MQRRIRAFTLVELLVVIGIIALLISILLPTLGKARQQATLVACSAQLRDIGNAIQIYAQYNKGFFPGPCYGQVRAGYWKDSLRLAEYLAPYLKMPIPSSSPKPGYDSSTPIVMPTLLCPGYRANNQISQAGVEWCYNTVGFEPYIWCGYPALGSVPQLTGDIIVNGKHMSPPRKLVQVFEGSEQPIIEELDQVLVAFITVGVPADLAPVPSHGGKLEKPNGMFEIFNATIGPYTNTNSPYYQIVDPKAAATPAPARNTLFADGHVAARRKSGPSIPRNVGKFGKAPAGNYYTMD